MKGPEQIRHCIEVLRGKSAAVFLNHVQQMCVISFERSYEITVTVWPDFRENGGSGRGERASSSFDPSGAILTPLGQIHTNTSCHYR
jgi:hypothetical protein